MVRRDSLQQPLGQPSPQIVFPCENYPIKVMGEASEAFLTFVLKTTEQFDPTFDRKTITVKESRQNRFMSITVCITATSVEQLQAYHDSLKNNPATKIVL